METQLTPGEIEALGKVKTLVDRYMRLARAHDIISQAFHEIGNVILPESHKEKTWKQCTDEACRLNKLNVDEIDSGIESQ